MKCPRCGYSSFAYLDECDKCGGDLVEFKMKHNIWELKPAGINFLYMEGAEEEFAEAAAEPVAEVAEEREPAEEVPVEEPLEAGELEADLLSIGAEEALSPAAQEAGVAAEEAALDMGFDAEELELPELEPVSETAEGEEVAQPAPVAEAEEEIDLTDIAADLEEVGVETELAAEAGRTEAGEVSEEEVLAASGQLDLSDLEEDLDLSEVLEEVAGPEPEAEEVLVTDLDEVTEDDVLAATMSLELGKLERAERGRGKPAEAREAAADAQPLPEIGAEETKEEPEAARQGVAETLDLESLEEELAAAEAGPEVGEEPLQEVTEGAVVDQEEPLPRQQVGKERTDAFRIDLADILEKQVEEPVSEHAVPKVDLSGLDDVATDADEETEKAEKARVGPTIDLSALEDVDFLEVEVVREDGGPEGEPELAPERGLEPTDVSEEKREGEAAPSGGIEAAGGDMEFELDDDWVGPKEEEDEEGKRD